MNERQEREDQGVLRDLVHRQGVNSQRDRVVCLSCAACAVGVSRERAKKACNRLAERGILIETERAAGARGNSFRLNEDAI